MGQKTLIIDTNLLLLLVIGAVEGGRHIQNSKRLNKFTLQDYDAILDVMASHQEICITHYIATLAYGLTDSSLVRLAADHTILTDDQRLFGALFSACAENILPFEVVRKVRE